MIISELQTNSTRVDDRSKNDFQSRINIRIFFKIFATFSIFWITKMTKSIKILWICLLFDANNLNGKNDCFEHFFFLQIASKILARNVNKKSKSDCYPKKDQKKLNVYFFEITRQSKLGLN